MFMQLVESAHRQLPLARASIASDLHEPRCYIFGLHGAQATKKTTSDRPEMASDLQ